MAEIIQDLIKWCNVLAKIFPETNLLTKHFMRSGISELENRVKNWVTGYDAIKPS